MRDLLVTKKFGFPAAKTPTKTESPSKRRTASTTPEKPKKKKRRIAKAVEPVVEPVKTKEAVKKDAEIAALKEELARMKADNQAIADKRLIDIKKEIPTGAANSEHSDTEASINESILEDEGNGSDL